MGTKENREEHYNAFLIRMAVFLLVIGVLLYKPIWNAHFKQRMNRITEYAKEEFLANDAAAIEESFRKNANLGDLWCEYTIGPAYGYEKKYLNIAYNERKDLLYISCVPDLYSSEIDRYYPKKYGDENAFKIYAKLKAARRNYSRKNFDYVTPYGNANIDVFLPPMDNRLVIKSPSGHEYEYSEFKSSGSCWLRIDGETMYFWTPSPSPSAETGSKKNGSGSTAGNSRGSAKKSSSKSSKKSSGNREIDPDDYDIDGYYEDNRDIYEDYEEAWEGFLDDEDAWEDY